MTDEIIISELNAQLRHIHTLILLKQVIRTCNTLKNENARMRDAIAGYMEEAVKFEDTSETLKKYRQAMLDIKEIVEQYYSVDPSTLNNRHIFENSIADIEDIIKGLLQDD